MRPDHRLREGEAEAAIEQAFRSYSQKHEARDVLLYVAHVETDLSWNELQSRAGLSPAELSDRLIRVEQHLRSALETYLEGSSEGSS